MNRPHTHAAIVSIGDELALGQSLDTNSRWLADRLLALGIPTVEHVTVGDDVDHTTRTFARLAAACPLVISTGGLGPTLDDLTRHAVAALLDEPLVTDAPAVAELERKLAARGRTITDAHRTQALRPRSAHCLPNTTGTAPGLHAVVPPSPLSSSGDKGEGRGEGSAPSSLSNAPRPAPSPREATTDGPALPSSDLFCLPGPPSELRPMFETSVIPLLRPPPGRVIRTRLLQVIGIGESDAAALVGDLMRRGRNPLVGITASGAQLTWRIRCEGADAAEAGARLDETEAAIRAALGPHIFASGETSLPQAVLGALMEQFRSLGTVESCTGGLLGELITSVPGSSERYRGGLITYSNQMKTALANVPSSVYNAVGGAVSRETAEAMAIGGVERLNVDECLAITGIAGPGGGKIVKPVGTVWIALARRFTHKPEPDWHSGIPITYEPPLVTSRRFHIPGDRDEIRLRAARTALGMLWLALNDALDGRPLLFERPG